MVTVGEKRKSKQDRGGKEYYCVSKRKYKQDTLNRTYKERAIYFCRF